MRENKELKINKPIHQESDNQNKILKYFDCLDKGQLALGIIGLSLTGGYLFPTVFTAMNITMISGGLIKLGVGGLGAIMGAMAIEEGLKLRNADIVDDLNELNELEEKDIIVEEEESQC